MIHRETFGASVLNHSDSNAVLHSVAKKKCLLTTPSLLSRGTRLSAKHLGCATREAIKQPLPHLVPDLPMVGFAMVVGAECSDIALDVWTAIRKWNHMMSFKKNSSIRLLKPRFCPPLPPTIGQLQAPTSDPGV